MISVNVLTASLKSLSFVTIPNCVIWGEVEQISRREDANFTRNKRNRPNRFLNKITRKTKSLKRRAYRVRKNYRDYEEARCTWAFCRKKNAGNFPVKTAILFALWFTSMNQKCFNHKTEVILFFDGLLFLKKQLSWHKVIKDIIPQSITLLLTPCKQKLADYVLLLHNQRF